MISWKMIRVLKEIQKHQKRNGACKASQINTYKDDATKYRSLNRLETINAIQKNKAPNSHKADYTYTLTQFGETLTNKAEKVKTK